MPAFINRISTAVPPTECHQHFVALLQRMELPNAAREKLIAATAQLGIERRYSVFRNLSSAERATPDQFGQTRSTAERMHIYQREALPLAMQAIAALLADDAESITHLIVTSCTGFYAPGIDIDIMHAAQLSPNVERTLIGFMGCYAAIPALRTAQQIVESRPSARVLIVNIELCSLHFRDNAPLDQLISFLLFADGCAASIVSARPVGLRLDRFFCVTLPNSLDAMRWTIGNDGFYMKLDAGIPDALHAAITTHRAAILHDRTPRDIALWAIHPGGRAILDAVQRAMDLPDAALTASRNVLRDFGNMSSATIMFVLQQLLADPHALGTGSAMAFGPGLSLESFVFQREPS